MIIHNLNLIHTILAPGKADTPLVVDADAMQPPAASFQGFEPIAGWNPQASQIGCRMQLQQFTPRYPFNVPEPRHRQAIKKRLGIQTGKRVNHAASILF
jgi:hypothetical protein